jgi:formate dehydrogenase subunit gamma
MTSHHQTVEKLVQRHVNEPGGLLPLLHDIQDAIGFIPEETIATIAHAMNRSRAEVHGVITYYHHFRTQPTGRHVVQICRAESCKACGADALLTLAKKTLGCDLHETSASGAVTLEPVFCLGLCASSPAVQVDERLHARMTQEKLETMLKTLERA